MSPIHIALIVVVVIIVGYLIYKSYFNTSGLSCTATTDCSAGQYCGRVSKKCQAVGSCIAATVAGALDDCGNASTCVSGKCQLKTGYCHSIGPIVATNPSDCAANDICIASTSQCMASSTSSGSSVGAPCTVAEDCAANDGWPNTTTTLPCNYYCDLTAATTTGGNSYGTCAASTCCTAASGCPNTNYPATSTVCDTASGFCIPPAAAVKQQAKKASKA